MKPVRNPEVKLLLEVGYYDGPIAGEVEIEKASYLFDELHFSQLKGGTFVKFFLMIPYNPSIAKPTSAEGASWRRLMMTHYRGTPPPLILKVKTNLDNPVKAWSVDSGTLSIFPDYEAFTSIATQLDSGVTPKGVKLIYTWGT